jgi:hypothetical protein
VDDLHAAVRPDFAAFLNDHWRTKITSSTSVLQLAIVPPRVFEFDALAALRVSDRAYPGGAARQGDGPARVYNPARAERIGPL